MGEAPDRRNTFSAHLAALTDMAYLAVALAEPFEHLTAAVAGADVIAQLLFALQGRAAVREPGMSVTREDAIYAYRLILGREPPEELTLAAAARV